jgi:2-oxoglutarate dehydrogenase E2 component (dihydrolipoamide succinyltransferase)
MSIDITVPTLGESVTEATIARWFKAQGDAVAADEPLVELETDKVTLEVNAPANGTLAEIVAQEGEDVEIGALLGRVEEGEAPAKPAEKPAEPAETKEPEKAAEAPAAAAGSQAGPAARKLADEKGVDLASVQGTGPKGNVTKADVAAAEPANAEPVASAPSAPSKPSAGLEERVKMTRLRKRIAERLKEAQNTAAMLTTFNEVDMSAVMNLRRTYQDGFVKKHGIKLGFMSFFVRASIEALKAYPAVNAEIDGDDIVYKHYYDIGVAVSSPAGLVVPVIRGADEMGLAEIEKAIADLGSKARDGKLAMEELMGGTFTITNGGIFGSMMSTPILNPPQVGILGMHNIVQRAVVMPDGSIGARPMMYIALSYDHRIVDGREAVSFLVRIKECIEDPQRILLET